MPIRDFAPLDQMGLTLNRPMHEAKWAKLTNVAFRDGSIVPRAGFKEAYGYSRQVVESAAVEPSPANGLVELWNPGSSTTGRGGAEWAGEILRPDGSSSLVAGWSASASTLHGDVDEVVPDGDIITSSTVGSQVLLTFANPVATYTDILGVRVYVRARVSYSGVGDAMGKLTLYQRSGSTNTQYAQFEVWAFNVDETAFWYDYSILLEKDYNQAAFSGGQSWEDSDLDNFNTVIEFTAGSSGLEYYLAPSAIDSNTGWVDAEDGGSANIADIKLGAESIPEAVPHTGYVEANFLSSSSGNGLAADSADDVIAISFAEVPAGVTFTAIDQVQVDFRVKIGKWSSCRYEMYYNNGSTDTLVASGVAEGTCSEYSLPIFAQMTTNPASASAWTKAEVNAASFKLKIKDSVRLVMEYASCTVTGTTNSATVQVDTVSAEVIAPGTSAVPAKLVFSNRSFLRLQPEDLTIDDVTNSVPSQSLPALAPFDWAVLYGQVYAVNGVDPTKRYPNAGSLFESLTTNNADGATPITGRTVAAFADRILYGWVRDNTTYTPERIAYSAEFNGGSHAVASGGGDFDIIDSMGGIVALRPLNESLCFCGKEMGVYALRRTGNSAAPIIVDPIDYETGCLAKMSAARVLLQGVPTIMFYGRNPTAGINVFAFDGTKVTPVGDAINPLLEELANPRTNTMAIAGVDPRTNSYVLFLSPGNAIDRSLGFAMNLNTGAWTRWDLPYSIYSTAQWSFQAETGLVSSSSTLKGVAFPGIPTMVLGGRNNLPLRSHALPFDTLTVAQNPASLPAPDIPGFLWDAEPRTSEKNIFTSTVETGDIQLVDPAMGELQIMSYRLHLDTINYGPVRFVFNYSIDGGLTYDSDTEVEKFIGTMDKDGRALHTFVDFDNPVHDRKIRFRIQAEPEDSVKDLPFFWQIDRFFIEYEVGAVSGA